jgi:hypothetical protein
MIGPVSMILLGSSAGRYMRLNSSRDVAADIFASLSGFISRSTSRISFSFVGFDRRSSFTMERVETFAISFGSSL